jgi:CDP-diacylglycerol--serine O-phosphatidyltransferase
MNMDGHSTRIRRRRNRPRRPRYHGPSFNRVIPNLLTLIGLCAGLTSIRYALEAKWQHAAVAVVVAGVIDGLDGRIARLLKAVSRFGAEFDSLSDFCCFGIAPALILYLWALRDAGRFGYMPCLMFAVCMALRLARFNASLESAPKPAYAQSFFTGVPAPAGAGLALLPLFLGLEAQEAGWWRVQLLVQSPWCAALTLVGTSVLLVSTLPVWSFKNFKVPTAYVLPLLLGTGFMAALLVADPWAALAAAALVYLAMLPLGLRSFHRLRAEAEDLQPDEIPTGDAA